MYICLQPKKINGIVGEYKVPSNHQLAQNTSGSNVYSLKITSMPETEFWFRIGVSGESNQMQPEVNGDPLTINEEGTQNPTYYNNISNGSDKAWKVSYTADEYEYLTVNVDITEDATRMDRRKKNFHRWKRWACCRACNRCRTGLLSRGQFLLAI